VEWNVVQAQLDLGQSSRSLVTGPGVGNASDLDIAKTFNNMGAVFDAQGEYDKALEHYKKSLVARIRSVGPDDTEVAKTYNNIGEVYRVQGCVPQPVLAKPDLYPGCAGPSRPVMSRQVLRAGSKVLPEVA
jgi:tetratricopeptide (TPR) repeat protein